MGGMAWQELADLPFATVLRAHYGRPGCLVLAARCPVHRDQPGRDRVGRRHADRCAVAGVEAFGSQWHRVTLQGCKLDSVNFRDAQLTVVVFGNCTLRDVDFTGGPWASSWTVGRFAGSAII